MENTKPPVVQKRVLNVFETGAMIGKGHNAVRELVRDGKIRALPRRNIKIPLVAIQEFLATATRHDAV